ncbi:MAG TPA: amino acid ABC transporter permease [Acetobacteraceae bacterium]|nr:amino acid ABC transporter permease [Acetobacteraceae bacterium]
MSSLFQPHLVLQYLVSDAFFHAASITLLLSIASLAVGMAVGLLLAVAQEAPLRAVRALVVVYLWLFRGTPVLLQIVFAFNVLPSFGIVLPGFACGVLALGLNEGAYMAEIMRSGIRAVGPGQRLAARAVGLEDWGVLRWVVLPQALRIIIPPIGNQFISMLKLSALVSVIGVQELLLVADQTASGNFRYIETLSAAGIYYLALTTLFMAIQSLIERRLRRRRTPRGAPRIEATRMEEAR